jgi:hypothetical protein
VPHYPHLLPSPRKRVKSSKKRIPHPRPFRSLNPHNNASLPNLLPHTQNLVRSPNRSVPKSNSLGGLPLPPTQCRRITVKSNSSGNKRVGSLQEPFGLPLKTSMKGIRRSPTPPPVINGPKPKPNILKSKPNPPKRVCHLPNTLRVPRHQLPRIPSINKLTPHHEPPR